MPRGQGYPGGGRSPGPGPTPAGGRWFEYGSYEGYLRFMVPRLGVAGVAEALGVPIPRVIEECDRLGVRYGLKG